MISQRIYTVAAADPGNPLEVLIGDELAKSGDVASDASITVTAPGGQPITFERTGTYKFSGEEKGYLLEIDFTLPRHHGMRITYRTKKNSGEQVGTVTAVDGKPIDC